MTVELYKIQRCHILCNPLRTTHIHGSAHPCTLVPVTWICARVCAAHDTPHDTNVKYTGHLHMYTFRCKYIYIYTNKYLCVVPRGRCHVHMPSWVRVRTRRSRDVQERKMRVGSYATQCPATEAHVVQHTRQSPRSSLCSWGFPVRIRPRCHRSMYVSQQNQLR